MEKEVRTNVAIRASREGLQVAGLCSGIGMLETALETALSVRGVPAQSCYHCEWEACTAAVLRRFIVASGGESLIHGNMFAADCSGLRGKVDAVIAGLPCPAFSVAGKQKGNGDSRAWGENFNPVDESTWGPQPHFLRLAEQILSGIVIIENVPQYLSGGYYAPVGEILYRLGYEYQDAILGTAESVGGSHKRERCFILAIHREYDIWARLREIGVEELADSGGARCEGHERRSAHGEPGSSASGPTAKCGEKLGDSNREARRDGSSRRQNKTGRWGFRSTETSTPLPIHAPGIDNFMAWSAVAKLDPSGTPSIESGVSVVATRPAIANTDLLRIGGNCVDALEATACIGCLIDRWLEGY
ncbi:MAG: DNA cytosine methyltransferase [Kiritimatiellae bacterium]|nr:DNA cytosine methyltransferase [Kiritimatiellia bacterium]